LGKTIHLNRPDKRKHSDFGLPLLSINKSVALHAIQQNKKDKKRKFVSLVRIKLTALRVNQHPRSSSPAETGL